MAAKQQPAKVKIDLFPAGPITFTAPVEIPTAGGDTLHIEFVFKHRTRKQLGELADARVARLKERFDAQVAERERQRLDRERIGEPPAEDDAFAPGKYVADAAQELEDSVEGLLEIAEGWNIDGAEFNAENLQALCNLHGAAANRISTTYREALANGRLGNSPR